MPESKKVGVVTMYYSNNNYGAVLQSYALPHVVNSLGYDCEQISFTYRNDESSGIASRVKATMANYGFAKTVSVVTDAFGQKLKQQKDKITGVQRDIQTRAKVVAEFRKDCIPHSESVFSNQTIENCHDYDTYICGSDQVWRAGWGFLNPGFWLTFAQPGAKKISYAASISLEVIPESEHQLIRDALKDYTAISVREKHGKEQLDKILQGKNEVNWVIDPTFLMKWTEWNGICADNPYSGKKYVFAYLLGENTDDRAFVKKFAKEKGLEIITLPYLLGQYRACDKSFGDIKLFDVSPKLFLSLIRDAEYVITDSFHGTVFSSLFHTDFYIFKRNVDGNAGSMNSRIYSLIDLLGCSDRLIEHNAELDSLSTSIDFYKIDSVLEKERERSLEFLKNALEK